MMLLSMTSFAEDHEVGQGILVDTVYHAVLVGEGLVLDVVDPKRPNQREFFGHQMAAREGIVSTGVGTAYTGYLNRRACKIITTLSFSTTTP